MTVMHHSSSSMHRVFGIPELLDMVFGFLDDASNASNARVCRKWSNMALDTLWRDVNDLNRLFSLLAPLRETVDNEYIFSRFPDSSDWKRFENYRRRVRRLSYHANATEHTLHQSVFDDLARTRTSLDILPCMHTLEWNAPLPLCVMFMHSNVKRFFINLPSVLRDTSPGPFFLDILARMPNIKHLDLRMDIPMRFIENEAINLFSSLKKLQKLTIPRFTLTTKVAESLSRLEHLETVEFQYFKRQGRGDAEDILQFNPSLTEGAFPALWDLSTTISCKDATRFFELPFAPNNLTTLYFDSQITETPADILQLFTVLADNCQLLKSLALISTIDASTSANQPPDKSNYIGIDILAPLFKCPNIVSFELTHQYPLYLHQADMEKIAVTWPSIEALLLNNEPVYLEQPTLTLQALLPFSRHCPNLRQLGLFIHASTADLPPSSTSLYTPFRSLVQLSMGVSLITNEGPVALFLSQICPLQCKLDSGVTWESADIAEWIADAVRTRCEKWDKVMELLPVLTELRIDERARTRALQEEVEDLRVRTGVFMDKAVYNPGDACVMI